MYDILSLTSCVLEIASLYSPTPGKGILAFRFQNAPTCSLAANSAATFPTVATTRGNADGDEKIR